MRRILGALDPRDHREAGSDLGWKLLLAEIELKAMEDHDPCEALEGVQPGSPLA